MFRLAPRLLLIMLIPGLLAGCQRGRGERPEAVPNDVTPAQAEESTLSHQTKILELAGRYIKQATVETGRLVYRNPYYLKEYTSYPEAPQLADVDIQERQSRSVPLAADVRVAKLRFATDVHTNRGQAREDEHYYRSTGTETISFELRSGRWKRVGTLFVADKTEEQVDGEWVDRKDPIVIQDFEPEDERGWFRRFWSGLTGRY
jgi:hypothetical protein